MIMMLKNPPYCRVSLMVSVVTAVLWVLVQFTDEQGLEILKSVIYLKGAKHQDAQDNPYTCLGEGGSVDTQETSPGEVKLLLPGSDVKVKLRNVHQ